MSENNPYWLSMRERLREAVTADGRSMRAISIAANARQNYLQQTLTTGRDPLTGQLSQVLDQLGPSSKFYVLTGHRITDADLAILDILSGMNDTTKAAFHNLLRQFPVDKDHDAASPHTCD